MSDDEIARNPVDDRVVDLLERTLTTRATTATTPPRLAAGARARRRHTLALQVVGAATTMAVLVVGAAVVPRLLGSDGLTLASEPATAGWRWESYRGLELQVPEAWSFGTSGQPWCLGESTTQERTPYVGRPGEVPAIACAGDVAPADQRVSYLWLGLAAGQTADLGNGWRVDVVHVGSEPFTLLTDDAAVRTHILDSAHLVDDTDANGCLVDHPVVADPALRPPAEPGLPTAAETPGATVCQYAFPDPEIQSGGPTLTASTRLDASDASALLSAVTSAGPGAGDIDTTACYEDLGENAARGNRIVIVRFEGSEGVQDVYVSLGGCENLRADDGSSVRSAGSAVVDLLTRGAISGYWSSQEGDVVTSVG